MSAHAKHRKTRSAERSGGILEAAPLEDGTSPTPGKSVRDLFDLSGRTAIISGGSVGLGRQMAEALAEMGANLVLCARKKDRCVQAAEELQKLGVKTLARACDVKNPAEVHAVVEATLSTFGRIDVLINNAGTSWGAPIEEMRLEHWNKVIETNLTGTFLFCQAVGKTMIAQRRGKIINIASVAGLAGSPPQFQAIGYHASKGGIIILTKDLACKWGMHNIQVNAIAPGWFPTNMSQVLIERNREAFLSRIPLNRFGSDHDLKGAAVFLASDASNFRHRPRPGSGRRPIGLIRTWPQSSNNGTKPAA